MMLYFIVVISMCTFGAGSATCDTSQTFTLSSGDTQLIKSPNYPEDYTNSLTSCWLIRTDPEQSLGAYIKDLETESVDTLTMYDGSSDTGPDRLVSARGTFGSYDGYAVSGSIQSSSYNYMYIKFSPDYSITYKGFQLCVYRNSEGRSGCDFKTRINLEVSQIIGIVFGVLAFIVILTVIICCLVNKKGSRGTRANARSGATVPRVSRTARVAPAIVMGPPKPPEYAQQTPAIQPTPQQPPPAYRPGPPPAPQQQPTANQASYPPIQPYPPPAGYPPPAYNDPSYPPPNPATYMSPPGS